MTRISFPQTLTLKALQTWGALKLRERKFAAPEKTARDLLLGITRVASTRLITHPDQKLSRPLAGKYRQAVQQRLRHIPLQYILGTEYFGGRTFVVGPGVLIPRPETELILEQARQYFPDHGLTGLIADLGTGSGIIALSLGLEFPRAQVWATDISFRALSWARRNRKSLRLGRRVRLLQGDAAGPILKKWHGQFSLVVSNPPYIARTDIKKLQPEVRREPRQALDGGPDGLDLIRHMTQAAGKLLKPQGLFICEIGIGQLPQVKRILKQHGFKFLGAAGDWQKIPRVVIGRRCE